MNKQYIPNQLRKSLQNQTVQIGCWSALANPISTEVLGLAGFDWILLDGEHAPNDISTFIPQLMALKDSKQSVASTRYPPAGIRGVSVAHRNNAYGTMPDYFATINDNISVIVQIETQKSVDNIDEIAAVDGVDCLFIGPGDLSAGMGYIGQPGHPEVQKAIKYVFDRAKAHGKASGILAPNENDARRYIEWGATFVAVGSDLGVFRSATQALCDKFKK